jgi:hypothetical protein
MRLKASSGVAPASGKKKKKKKTESKIVIQPEGRQRAGAAM